METCLVSWVIVETCGTTVCASWLVVFLAGGVASFCLRLGLVVRLVLIELIAVLTVETESVTDSSSTLIF